MMSIVRHNGYNRAKAQQYAERWWNEPNPDYRYFEVDCTNYVSQCLYAGGVQMNYTGKKDKGWWYRGGSQNAEWSYSWSVSHSLFHYLASSRSTIKATMVPSVHQLTIGDVIIYDWDGDSTFQHSTIVTASDAHGSPLINAHTVNSRMRPWHYRDSPAWSSQTQYRFFHIHD